MYLFPHLDNDISDELLPCFLRPRNRHKYYITEIHPINPINGLVTELSFNSNH